MTNPYILQLPRSGQQVIRVSKGHALIETKALPIGVSSHRQYIGIGCHDRFIVWNRRRRRARRVRIGMDVPEIVCYTRDTKGQEKPLTTFVFASGDNVYRLYMREMTVRCSLHNVHPLFVTGIGDKYPTLAFSQKCNSIMLSTNDVSGVRRLDRNRRRFMFAVGNRTHTFYGAHDCVICYEPATRQYAKVRVPGLVRGGTGIHGRVVWWSWDRKLYVVRCQGDVIVVDLPGVPKCAVANRDGSVIVALENGLIGVGQEHWLQWAWLGSPATCVYARDNLAIIGLRNGNVHVLNSRFLKDGLYGELTAQGKDW